MIRNTLARAFLLLGALGVSGLVLGCGGAPSIPHAITSQADPYCLGCHQQGTNGAPRAPHPNRTGCADCHEP